jgi:hypothetical protein
MEMEIITLSEICESIYRSFSKFEDIKEVMRNHISINRRQWNGQKKKINNFYKIPQKSKF